MERLKRQDRSDHGGGARDRRASAERMAREGARVIATDV